MLKQTYESDGYGNYIITQQQSLLIVFIIAAICILFPFGAELILHDFTSSIGYHLLCLLPLFIMLLGLRRVPYKHYGLRTFGKPIDNIPEGQLVYEQGLHWIYPWCGMRVESIEPVLISYQLDNIQTINNIIFSVKGSVLYRMGNAAKFSQHKTEAEKRIRAGVENGINKLIKTQQLTDRDLSSSNEEIKEYIFNEIEHLNNDCGFWILQQSIEWNKPLNVKVIDNFAEEAKFTSQIKRIATLAKELNITAEEAFRIEGIMIGIIKSTDSVFKISGAKEIIEAAKVFMTK